MSCVGDSYIYFTSLRIFEYLFNVIYLLRLPLPNEIPKLFAMLPEWIIEDVVEFFIFVGK